MLCAVVVKVELLLATCCF